MKKYNIIEALNMPEGTKFKRIDKGSCDPEAIYEVKSSMVGNYLSYRGQEIELSSNTVNYEFEEILEPMTFAEMINKVSESPSDMNITITLKINTTTKEWDCLDDLFYNLSYNLKSDKAKGLNCILNGKWYVETNY